MTGEALQWNPQKSFAPYWSAKGIQYYIRIKKTFKANKTMSISNYVWSIHQEEGQRLEAQGVSFDIESACLEAEEAMQKLVKPKHLRLMKGIGE